MKSSLALTGQLHEDRARARAHIALAAIAIGAAVTLYIQLHRISDFVTFGLLGVSRGAHLGAAIAFFVYEVPKVLLLLTAVVFAVGVLRSFVTPERARKMLAGQREDSRFRPYPKSR
jgi:hypothetical protein